MINFKRVLILGDFNLPKVLSGTIALNSTLELPSWLTADYGLSQIAYLPKRGESLLDLIFVSAHFASSNIIDLLPVAG